MEAQLAEFRNKGMMQDASISKSSNEFAFKNVNIRITAVNDNTLFSVTNEKRTSDVSIKSTHVAIPNKITFVEEHRAGQDVYWKAVSENPVASDIEISFEHHGEFRTYYFYINEGESESNIVSAWSTDWPNYQNTEIDVVEDNNYTYYINGDTVPDDRILILDGDVIGEYIGKCILGDNLIIFTKQSGCDRIYRCKILDNGNLLADCIVERNLGFDGPVETVGYFEREDIQKVYWVDGVNPNRVINIMLDADEQPDSFDFIPNIDSIPAISVEKEYNGAGSFPSGTIQYFVSYYNKLGQETKIANATHLYYITRSDRGGAPGDTMSCSFKIVISGLDTAFENVRIYSAIHSTIDGPIDARIVGNYAIPNSGTISFIDNGRNEIAIDPNVLYYIGGDRFFASTIEDKDGVLFFGNISTGNTILSEDEIINIQRDFYNKETCAISIITESLPPDSIVHTRIQSDLIVDEDVVVELSDSGNRVELTIQKGSSHSEWIVGDYSSYSATIMSPDNQNARRYVYYISTDIEPSINNTLSVEYYDTNIPTSSNEYSWSDNLMSPSNVVKHFKYRNIYKFAIQFIGDGMQATDAIDIGSCAVNLAPSCVNNNDVYVPKIKFSWPQIHFSQDIINRFSYYKILMAETSESTRIVFAQGIINPTVFRLGDRIDGSGPYAIPSWITRPENTPNSRHLEIVGGHDYTNYALIVNRAVNSFKPERNHEISYINNVEPPYFGASPSSESYYIDKSILTFNSPDIDKSDIVPDGLKFQIVGIAHNSYMYSDFQLTCEALTGKTVGFTRTSKTMMSENETKQDGTVGFNWNSYSCGAELPFQWVQTNSYYPIISIWQNSNSILPYNSDRQKENILKSKLYSCYKYCNRTAFFNSRLQFNDALYSLFNGSGNLFKVGNKYISGNYDYLSAPLSAYNNYYIFETDNQYKKHSPLWFGSDTTACSPNSSSPTRIRVNYSKFVAIDIGNSILPWVKDPNDTGLSEAVPKWEPIINGLYSPFKYYWGNNDDVDIFQPKINGYIYDAQSSQNIGTLNGCGLEHTDEEWCSASAYIFVGELLRKLDQTGIDEKAEALYGNSENIKWISCGPIKSIGQDTGAEETEGDTFFQRYECLRAYPYAEGDENSVVDIVSFMVETYQNLDARYDNNRGYGNMNYARPTNYGLLNSVYNQANNIFKYNTINESLQYQNFPQQFAWSLNKSAVSEIDAWTSATLSNIYNADGSYGPINAIEKLNDTLVAFQDRAIFVINFNNRTQISTEQGLPIELANSGKVDGITYLTRHYGCKNKYSIVSTKTGLYFIDDENRAFVNISKDGIADITVSSGMSVWFEKQTSYNKKWGGGNIAASSNHNAFVVGYDSNRGDIYIMNGTNSDAGCLVYNETLKTFTSFFDVSTTGYKFPLMYNFDGETYGLDGGDNSFNKLFGGTYGSNYSVEYRVNPEPLVGKIFTNIDYIADVYNTQMNVDDAMSLANISTSQPFDEISVFNEYQQKINVPLTENKWLQPTNATMFRIRHAEIPSTGTYGIDRMHNPWIHLKLNGNAKNALMQFHSLTVKYFK